MFNTTVTNENFTAPRKVTIMAVGSRGDIQPFVAIAIALKQKMGCVVRVMAPPSATHTKLLKDFGLDFVPIGPDAEAYMKNDEEMRTSMETGNTLKFFKCITDFSGKHSESICQSFHDEVIAGNHCPDLLIVSYLYRFFGLYAKFALNIPAIEVKLQHWVFDDPKRAPMGMPTVPLGLHKLIHTKIMIPQDYHTFEKFDECIANISCASNKMTSTTTTTTMPQRLNDFLLFDQWYNSEVNHSPLLPILIAQSPLFKDALYPKLPSSPNLKFVGPAIIESNHQIKGDISSFGGEFTITKLRDFLALDVERKPVYMGWGSMIRQSTKEMVLFAVEALRKSHQRGIILGGFAELSMEVLKEAVASSNNSYYADDSGREILEYAKENILFVDEAPHEWLFPQVSLTVHHGGAGTLNAAMRAGVPTIVTPVFGDQYDNSFVVQKLGIGVGFEQKLQKIDANDLSDAIHTVLNDAAMAERAEKLGIQMRNECGCKKIVEEVETYWRETVKSGELLDDIKEWKIDTVERKYSNERKLLQNRYMFCSALVIVITAFFIKEHLQ